MVPLGRGLAAILGGEGALASAAIDGRHARAVDGEDVAVSGVAPSVAVFIFEHLHFHAAMEGLALGGIGIGPHKNASVAARLEVAPFEFKNEILVHARGAQFADGFTGAMNHTLLHRPRLEPAIDVVPAVEVFAIEEQLEVFSSGYGSSTRQGPNEK